MPGAVPQLERCPRGGKFFAGGATKLSKLVLISENKNKKKVMAPIDLLNFKFSADLKKKRLSPQIGLLFCEFSVGPKKTTATVLKLARERACWGAC